MKKTLITLMLCLITLNFCSCSSNEPQSPNMETQYYNYAQQCIDEGNIEQAISVLEEGITNTGSKKLEELLNQLTSDSLNSTTTSKATTTTMQEIVEIDFEHYIGEWYCPEFSQDDDYFITELSLEIAAQDNEVTILLLYSCDGEYYSKYYGTAEVEKVVSLSAIKDNVLLLNYDDDGNGNSGTLEFTFANDRIFCTSTVNERINEYGEYYIGPSLAFGTCKFERTEDGSVS